MFRDFRARWPVFGVLLALAPAFAAALFLARPGPCRVTYAAFEARFAPFGIHRCPGDPFCRLVIQGEDVTAYHFQPDTAGGGLCLARTQRRFEGDVAALRGASPAPP